MYYYSNEIVWRGHPDKVCDQISMAILAECMRQDKNTRAGIEVMGGKGCIFITGEVTTKAKVDVVEITKKTLADIGYRTDYKIIDNIGKQSEDIALGTNDEVGGAGDQGMMFGYACNDTKQMLPTAMVMLQELAAWYDELRKKDTRFLPDGKCQITGKYGENKNLISITDWTISYQNTELEREATDAIIINKAKEIAAKYGVEVERFLVNPTGKFLIGGFDGDAGLTGRKIVVDAYEGFSLVGGGCLNGKDPTKVDFSGAHKAREIACRFLENHKWVEVQLSYAIGLAKPLAIYIHSDEGDIEAPKELYDECTPARIIKDLNMKEMDFVELAKFGHFR